MMTYKCKKPVLTNQIIVQFQKFESFGNMHCFQIYIKLHCSVHSYLHPIVTIVDAVLIHFVAIC